MTHTELENIFVRKLMISLLVIFQITLGLLEEVILNMKAQDTNKVEAEDLDITAEGSEGVVDSLSVLEWAVGLIMDHLLEIWDVEDPGWVGRMSMIY